MRFIWVSKTVNIGLSVCGLSDCPMHLPKALSQRILSAGTQFFMCEPLETVCSNDRQFKGKTCVVISLACFAQKSAKPWVLKALNYNLSF